MRKIHLVMLFFLVLLLTQCTEKYPKEVIRPEYGLENTKTLEIDKVLLTDSATILYIDAYFRPGNWIRIDSATYLLAEGKKYVVQSAEGIKLHEHHYMPESGEDHFTLTFPPLPKGTKSFDFIESDCDNCFKIWDVDLTGRPQKYTPDMPSEILNMETDRSVTFAEPELKKGKTKVTLHVSGIKEGYALNNVFIAVDNILLANRKEIEGKKESEGTYLFEIDQYSTAYALLMVENSFFPLFLAPGDNAEIYVDLTAKSKYSSRYNPKKELKYIAFKGEFGDINNQLVELFSKIADKTIDVDLFTYGDTTVVDMSKEEFVDKLFEKYSEKLAGLENAELTVAQKQFVKNTLKLNVADAFVNLSNMYMSSYWQKNKQRWGTKVDYTPPTLVDEDYLKLKDLDLGNINLLYSKNYIYTASVWSMTLSPKILDKVTGGEKGLLHDLSIVSPIIRKASSMEALTDADEKALASTSNPYYAEVYKDIYANTKKLYEESISRGGFTIEETPQATNDKILEAIIAKYKGQAVFVDFWATWCGPCLMAMKTIKPIKPEMAEKGVVSIYISNSSSPKAEWVAMLTDIGGIHYYLNEKQWEALSLKYGIKGIPTYMIFDKAGKKTFQQSGYPGNDKVLEELSKAW